MEDKPGTAARISIDEAEKQLTELKLENDGYKAQVDALTKQLNEVTDILQAQLRSDLTKRIRILTNYTPDQLEKMSLDELEIVANVAAATKTPHKNIHLPGARVDEAEPHPLEKIFEETWARKK